MESMPKTPELEQPDEPKSRRVIYREKEHNTLNIGTKESPVFRPIENVRIPKGEDSPL